MNLENTQTEENLRKALAGESIARNKYTYFAQAARKNGDHAIADAFEEMAKNEMMHAQFWFEQLFGKPEKTKTCLITAAQGEFSEWHNMYPSFAEVARQEGLDEIATMFEQVAAIEKNHENRFLTLLAQMNKTDPSKVTPDDSVNSTSIIRQKKRGFRCQFCGATFDYRPDSCKVCDAIGSFDEVEYYE